MGGGELGWEEGDEEIPLPVFEVQPAMLAVDLALSPGESRSCECPPLHHPVPNKIHALTYVLQTHTPSPSPPRSLPPSEVA